MAEKNYKGLIQRNLAKMCEAHPSMSFVEILRAVLRPKNSGLDIDISDLKWTFHADDRALLTAIERASSGEAEETTNTDS